MKTEDIIEAWQMKKRDSIAADIVHQYEMISDLRQEIYELRMEIEWLRLPWIVRITYDIWQFFRAPFGEWGKTKHGGDM